MLHQNEYYCTRKSLNLLVYDRPYSHDENPSYAFRASYLLGRSVVHLRSSYACHLSHCSVPSTGLHGTRQSEVTRCERLNITHYRPMQDLPPSSSAPLRRTCTRVSQRCPQQWQWPVEPMSQSGVIVHGQLARGTYKSTSRRSGVYAHRSCLASL